MEQLSRPGLCRPAVRPYLLAHFLGIKRCGFVRGVGRWGRGKDF